MIFMKKAILDFYLNFSTYTNPGLYKDLLKKDLPDEVREIGNLVRASIIHRTTLSGGNTGTNSDLKFGDMQKVPWYKQPEDDILVTASAMLSELYSHDKRGFILERKEKDKLILTCRFVSILSASILKSKDIPCRVRSGHAPYFVKNLSIDHWINQYWDEKKKRWITIDVDGSWSLNEKLDPYDLPENKFDFAADAWLSIREGKTDQNRFWNACSKKGSLVVFWSLFYDFHSLMNNEIIYLYGPSNGFGNPEKFASLSEKELQFIDELARLMQKPDENFAKLKEVWDTNKDFRLLSGGLL